MRNKSVISVLSIEQCRPTKLENSWECYGNWTWI